MMVNTSSSDPDFVFPSPPRDCPPDLAKPSSQYRTRAWLAMLGLSLFVILYLGLTLWFAWSAYYLLVTYQDDDIITLIKGIGSGLIAIFFIKGLFFKKESGGAKDFEITREQQPRLFEFLDRLAAETKAPRPHKVFLSGGVNACVFYDLSILNFIFPSRKNLEIGLGLVNSLTLTEFKAVLAHEFGHFAQSTMTVGRWVYVAQQVAIQLIFHRDWFDSLLSAISRFDLRVAWIGWVLRIVIWAIRSILDTMLSFVMLAHRALSREMEYQADLVAVTNTGSDPLVNALHRLAPADSAWDETTSFVGAELGRGHAVADLFAIQSRILEHNRRILDDADYGNPPQLPAENRAAHRVFTPDLAQPPQMWSTHPANHLREENAKKCYVPSEFVDQSAWCVFVEPETLRQKFTQHLLASLKKPTRPLEETLVALDKDYEKHFLNPDYRGTYLGRSIVSHTTNPSELYIGEIPDREELYPSELTDILEKHRNLLKERALLKALRDRHFEPVDGVIRFRGEVIKRSHIGEALETVEADFNASNQVLAEHDRKCRTYHRSLAEAQGRGWPAYLEGLLALVHYADHSLRNLVDAHALFHNTLAIVVADGSVSNSERVRLLTDAGVVYRVLKKIHQHSDKLILDSKTARCLDKPQWSDNFEALKLQHPDDQNLGDWINVLSGWVGDMANALGELRTAALENLLESESLLEKASHGSDSLESAPQPPRLPADYDTLIEGKGRDLQTKLKFWDRFQTASGIVPATLRFLVAGFIVWGAIWLTLDEGSLIALRSVLTF